MIKLPALLRYDRPLLYGDGTQFQNMLMYVLEYYGNDGYSLLIKRDKKLQEVAACVGDWNGNKIDLNALRKDQELDVNTITQKHLPLLNDLMRTIGIEQAQYYFAKSDKLYLCDVQISLNKFLGPGMLKDIFSRIMDVPKVISIVPIDDNIKSMIIDGVGDYAGDLILKPSKFKLYHDAANNKYQPLYAIIKR
jgi:hypothetical protein